ncbi:MAG: phosphotransferase [Pseudomonadota bacterium]
MTVAERLRHIPGFDERVAPVELASGESHAAFRIVVAGAPAVARIGDTPAAREVAVHRRAAAAGLAPPLLHVEPDAGLLVTRYIDGGTLSRADFDDPGVCAAAGRLLRRVHALPPTGTRLHPVAAARRYRGRLSQVHSARGDIETARIVELYADVADEPVCLCHGDPVPANIAGPPWQLIDWEWAIDIAPQFDLAALSVEAALDEQRTNALLAAYGWPEGDPRRCGLAHWQALYRGLAWLWRSAAAATSRS